MDSIAVKVQSLLPSPNNSNTLINNYNVPVYSNTKVTSNPSVKIDHNISPTIKISGYWSRQLSSNPNHNGLDEVLTSVTPQADRSTTVRLNYDQTLTPTTLLHLGAGLLYTTQAVIPQRYDPATLGLIGYDTGAFPNFTGLSDATTGGNGIGIGVGGGTGKRSGSAAFCSISPPATGRWVWVLLQTP